MMVFLFGILQPNLVTAQGGPGGCTEDDFIKILSGKRTRSNGTETFQMSRRLLSPKKATFEATTRNGNVSKNYVISIIPNRSYSRNVRETDCSCNSKLSGKVIITEKGNRSKTRTAKIINGKVVPPPQQRKVKFDIPWGLAAYAVCFYSGWAGGGDPVEVGDDCREDWW